MNFENLFDSGSYVRDPLPLAPVSEAKVISYFFGKLSAEMPLAERSP